MIYRKLIRPVAFRLDPESAHERAIGMLAALSAVPGVQSSASFTDPRLSGTIAGLKFPNPVGLAAGCDKNARALGVWPRFGFGFVETGTVTAQPQPGNPKPRMFRFPQQDAVINRLGFNSDGATVVAQRLAKLRYSHCMPVPLGVNIGKTKLVSGDEATLEDYRQSYRNLAPYADFIVVNVSSPNTPGLRQWQEKDKLRALLAALLEEGNQPGTDNKSSGKGDGRRLPLFFKISPDMADSDMGDVVELSLDLGITGIIATNTTIARPGETEAFAESGGLSGRPLRSRANEVMRFLSRLGGKRLHLVGVGGIASAEDAYERIKSGASLVQCYTALVYEGPYLAKRINQGLIRMMEHDGVNSISDLVGVEA